MSKRKTKPATPARPQHYYEVRRDVEFTITVAAENREEAAYKVAKMPLRRAIAAAQAGGRYDNEVQRDGLVEVRALYHCPGCGQLVHFCDGCGGYDELCESHDEAAIDRDDELSDTALRLGDPEARSRPACADYARRYRARQRKQKQEGEGNDAAT